MFSTTSVQCCVSKVTLVCLVPHRLEADNTEGSLPGPLDEELIPVLVLMMLIEKYFHPACCFGFYQLQSRQNKCTRFVFMLG